MNKSTRCLTIVICICINYICFGQSGYKINEHAKKIIDSTYNAQLKKYKVEGASIAIVDNGEIVYATGYGFSDKAAGTKADEKTIYRIGSCTKSFTAISILQLQDKGLLNINNSIKNYLTDLTISSRFNDNNQLFIKDIMSHTSGLPCDIINGFFCDSPPDIKWVINELNKQTTISPPAYKHAYSNVGYGLLGELVARTSKTSYSDYVKNNVFVPLGMNSSYIDYDETLAKNFSKGYYKSKEVKEPLIRDQAAGLIHSNALDMGNYLKMFLNKGKLDATELISEESIQLMIKNHLANTKLSSAENWGYGLYSYKAMVKSDKDSSVVNVIGHGGDTYAFHSDFVFIPELNVGAVVMTNTDNGSRMRSASRLIKLYIKEAKGKKVDLDYEEPKTINTNEKECSDEEKVGSYNYGPFIMNVKNTKKIKFKQGPATIVLSQKKLETANYTLKARLFKIIPVNVKNQELKFVKLDNAIYVKALNTKTKEEDFMTTKKPLAPIPDKWKKMYGKYVAIDYYKCKDCPFTNTEGISIELSEEAGYIKLKIKGKTSDVNSVFYLEILSDTMCVTGGIGRGLGETFKILDNGNIYYSGFEFKK